MLTTLRQIVLKFTAHSHFSDAVRSLVSEVKAAIENGEYEIDADAIADAMIRFERSFGE